MNTEKSSNEEKGNGVLADVGRSFVPMHGFENGERALRRNSGYPDEPQQWIEFTFNETYLKLAHEFPEDYRTLDGRRWIKNNVQCDICENEWYALYIEGTPQLQCPKCKQMAYHKVL